MRARRLIRNRAGPGIALSGELEARGRPVPARHVIVIDCTFGVHGIAGR